MVLLDGRIDGEELAQRRFAHDRGKLIKPSPVRLLGCLVPSARPGPDRDSLENR